MVRSVFLIGVVVAAGLIGVGHVDADLDAGIDISDAECDESQNITALSVKVIYHGDSPVEGVFRGWMQRDRVRMAWETPVIKPGMNRLRIEAPSERTVLRYGERGQIMLSVGQKRAFDHFSRGEVC
jgi:hypothetical protein